MTALVFAPVAATGALVVALQAAALIAFYLEIRVRRFRCHIHHHSSNCYRSGGIGTVDDTTRKFVAAAPRHPCGSSSQRNDDVPSGASSWAIQLRLNRRRRQRLYETWRSLLRRRVALAAAPGSTDSAPPAARATASVQPPPVPSISTAAAASVTERELEEADRELRRNHKNGVMNALFDPCVDELPPTPLPPKQKSSPPSIDADSSGSGDHDHLSLLPTDLPAGCLLRIGPNPRPGSACPSFLDGDGMIHAITIAPPPAASSPSVLSAASSSSESEQGGEPREEEEGHRGGVNNGEEEIKSRRTLTPRKVTYSRAWVQAQGYEREQAAGRQLFAGTLTAPRGWPMLGAMASNAWRTSTCEDGVGMQVQKDTANTALVAHGGKILALMEQSRPSEIRVSRGGSVSTARAFSDLDGSIPPDPVTGGALSAHARLDAATGERVSVSYSSSFRPYARVDTFAPDGRLARSVGVDIPTPVMIHDLAITQNYAVVLDLPMTIRVERTLSNTFPVAFEPEAGARIGLCRRRVDCSDSESVLWVDIEPCVVLHTCNAYERRRASDSGVEVVLHGLRSVPKTPQSYIAAYTPAFLYEWVIDVATGKCVSERCLSALPLEFPVLNPALHGRQAKSFFAITPASAGGPLARYGTPAEGIVIDGLARVDLTSGAADVFRLPPGQFVVSEPTFVPRDTSADDGSDEDDGYVFLITSDVDEVKGHRVPGGSKLLIFDAAHVSDGPVCSLPLPATLPYGLHSAWVPWHCLDEEKEDDGDQ